MNLTDCIKPLPLLFLLRSRISFSFLAALVLGAIFVYPHVENDADLLGLAVKADGGDIRAQVSLGICFAVGQYVDRDMDMAVTLWKSALKQALRNVTDWAKKTEEKKNAPDQVSSGAALPVQDPPRCEGGCS